MHPRTDNAGHGLISLVIALGVVGDKGLHIQARAGALVDKGRHHLL